MIVTEWTKVMRPRHNLPAVRETFLLTDPSFKGEAVVNWYNGEGLTGGWRTSVWTQHGKPRNHRLSSEESTSAIAVAQQFHSLSDEEKMQAMTEH